MNMVHYQRNMVGVVMEGHIHVYMYMYVHYHAPIMCRERTLKCLLGATVRVIRLVKIFQDLCFGKLSVDQQVEMSRILPLVRSMSNQSQLLEL